MALKDIQTETVAEALVDIYLEWEYQKKFWATKVVKWFQGSWRK